MKKFLFFLMYILIFATVFAASGLVAYFVFSGEQESDPVSLDEQNTTQGGVQAITIHTSDDEMLTIVQPALDVRESRVSYGRLADLLNMQGHSETPSDIPENIDTPENDAPQQTTQQQATQQQTTQQQTTPQQTTQQQATPQQTTQQHSTQQQTTQQQTTPQQTTQQQATPQQTTQQQTTPVEPTPQQTAPVEPAPQQTTPVEPAPPLNPNVQTSDTGL